MLLSPTLSDTQLDALILECRAAGVLVGVMGPLGQPHLTLDFHGLLSPHRCALLEQILPLRCRLAERLSRLPGRRDEVCSPHYEWPRPGGAA